MENVRLSCAFKEGSQEKIYFARNLDGQQY